MATDPLASALIGSDELANTDAVIIDASWHMPAAKRNAKEEYEREHIAGACFFDLDACSDAHSGLPHMLPSPEVFSAGMQRLGVSNQSDVVVYDSIGIFSAPRLWWMLRAFGHEQVRVLDGGLPAWKRHYGTEAGSVEPDAAPFTAKPQSHLLATRDQVAMWSLLHARQICDARSPSRFLGYEPEPRAGVRSGHIAGSLNLHYAQLLTDAGTMKSKPVLQDAFEKAGIVPGDPIVTSCGSGVTACILALALYELGYSDVPVYDGSWAEWGASALPIAISG